MGKLRQTRRVMQRHGHTVPEIEGKVEYVRCDDCGETFKVGLKDVTDCKKEEEA